MSNLPFVDRLSIEIDAPATTAWSALVDSVAKASRSKAPLAVGATLPGFSVVTLSEPAHLGLAGSHFFARYTLEAEISAIDDRRCRLSAITHAVFSGLKGALYRALVIGSGGHVVVVNQLLRIIKRRAENLAAVSRQSGSGT